MTFNSERSQAASEINKSNTVRTAAYLIDDFPIKKPHTKRPFYVAHQTITLCYFSEIFLCLPRRILGQQVDRRQINSVP